MLAVFVHSVVCSLLLLAVPQLPASSAQGPQEEQPCPGYTTTHPDCQFHGNCQEVECTYPDQVLQRVTLSVQNCEDPVQVTLRVVGDGIYWIRGFNVTGEQSRCSLQMPATDQLFATYSRNASHLQFDVSVVLSQECSLRRYTC